MAVKRIDLRLSCSCSCSYNLDVIIEGDLTEGTIGQQQQKKWTRMDSDFDFLLQM